MSLWLLGSGFKIVSGLRLRLAFARPLHPAAFIDTVRVSC